MDIEQFIQATSDFLWKTDAQFRFSYISANWRALTGLIEPLGMTLEEIGEHGQKPEIWHQHQSKVQGHQSFRDLIWRITKQDDALLWLRLAGVPRFNEDGQFDGYTGSALDITSDVNALGKERSIAMELAQSLTSLSFSERRASIELEDKIEELAKANLMLAEQTGRYELAQANAERVRRHDKLTGLLNLRSFLEQGNIELERYMRNRSTFPPAIALIAIDDLKEMARVLGLASSDKVLATVAARIAANIRKSDILARTGSEEFAILFAPADIAECVKGLERIQQAVGSAHEFMSSGIGPVTLTVGIAAVRADDTTIEEPVSRAEQASFHAKRSNCSDIGIFEAESAIV